MDTRADSAIVFDADGRCDRCEAQLRRLAEWRQRGSAGGAEALADRVRAAGRSSRYDIIVGLSGGGDSCLMVCLAKELGLRVLAVHMDNGWDTALSVRNVKRIVETLGVDYESFVLDWEEFRDLQLAFFKASTPEIETPTDMAIPGTLHRVAVRHDVKHIAFGSNLLNEGMTPPHWHYNRKDLKFLIEIHKRFGTTELRHFPAFGYRDEAYYKVVKGIRIIYPLRFISYSHQEAARKLRSLGWEPPGGKHYESVITRFVQSYVLPMKFGFDYRYPTLSAQICAGIITRDAALAELEAPPIDPDLLESDKDYVAKKYGITTEELDRIIALPPKTYADYPNDAEFLEGVYSLYRRYVSLREPA